MYLLKTDISRLFHLSLSTVYLLLIPELVMASVADGKAMEGMELYKKQEFDQASKKFLEARKGKPNDPKISYNLGNSYYKQGKFDEALQGYYRSTNQKSNTVIKQKSAYNMGNTLFRMDKLNESVTAYKKALKLDPNDMDAKFNLEFVREQIEKKKQEQQKQNKLVKEEKDHKSSGKTNQNKNQNNNSDLTKNQNFSFINEQKQNNSQYNPSPIAEVSQDRMTKEEAEQKLNTLTEDLKEFQRKQALDMKSLFTYQGPDW